VSRLWPLRDARLAHWMRRAQGGDREAFRALYRALHPVVSRFVVLRVFNGADAEDLVSQVFFRLLEALPGYASARGPVLTWALAIARNAVTDHFRRPAPAEAQIADRPDTAPSPLETLVRAEQRSALHRELSALPDDVQQLLLMRYGDGLRCAEIALLLGERPATVRQRLSRTVRSLKEKWSLEGA
jgi:RNA polymerase sigma-70 factor (ECF subfamily)